MAFDCMSYFGILIQIFDGLAILYFHTCYFKLCYFLNVSFQLRTLFDRLALQYLIHFSMKGAFTIIVDKTSKHPDVISKLDQHFQESKLQVIRKQKTGEGQCVYTFGVQNFTSSNRIQVAMEEISTKLGLQAKGPFAWKEICLDKELEKISSQEIWTLSEQNSISLKTQENDSQPCGTDGFQKIQEISDQSQEFQLLAEETQQIQRVPNLNEIEIKNTPNEQKLEEKIEPSKEQEAMENHAKIQGTSDEHKQDEILSDVQVIEQKGLRSSAEYQKNNITKQIAEGKISQKGQPLIEQDQDEHVDGYVNEETTQILFNYFTGKDDYTQVFNVKKGDDKEQVQIEQSQHKITQIQVDEIQENPIFSTIQPIIQIEPVSEIKQEPCEATVLQTLKKEEKTSLDTQKPTEIQEKNINSINQEPNQSQLSSSQFEQNTQSIYVAELQHLLTELELDSTKNDDQNQKNQPNDASNKVRHQTQTSQNLVLNLAKYAILIAIILALLANCCL